MTEQKNVVNWCQQCGNVLESEPLIELHIAVTSCGNCCFFSTTALCCDFSVGAETTCPVSKDCETSWFNVSPSPKDCPLRKQRLVVEFNGDK